MFEVSLKGKVAWVTGASRGIGAAVAKSLAKAGCDVALSFKSNLSLAEAVAADIHRLDQKTLLLQADLRNKEDVDQCFSKIIDRFSRIDILVNAAGITRDNLLLMLEEKDWDDVLQTNLLAAVHTSKVVLQQMMQQRYGRIIQISSVAASKGGRGQANYAASKAALEAMSRSLAVEVGKRGITINCIAPGVIETDMSQEIIRLAKDEILQRQVIKRFGSVDEVAAWAVFLASDYSSFMTGQTICIDGGMKMP